MQPRRGQAVERLRNLHAQRVGSHRCGSEGDAGNQPIRLAHNDPRQRQQPAEDSEVKQRLKRVAIELWPKRAGAEKNAQSAELHPHTGDDDHEACQENAGHAAADARQHGRQDQRQQPPGDAHVHCGSVALERALGANAYALDSTHQHDDARDAQRPQAVVPQRSIMRDHVPRHVG